MTVTKRNLFKKQTGYKPVCNKCIGCYLKKNTQYNCNMCIECKFKHTRKRSCILKICRGEPETNLDKLISIANIVYKIDFK